MVYGKKFVKVCQEKYSVTRTRHKRFALGSASRKKKVEIFISFFYRQEFKIILDVCSCKYFDRSYQDTNNLIYLILLYKRIYIVYVHFPVNKIMYVFIYMYTVILQIKSLESVHSSRRNSLQTGCTPKRCNFSLEYN